MISLTLRGGKGVNAGVKVFVLVCSDYEFGVFE